jgi:hypothetical protein
MGKIVQGTFLVYANLAQKYDFKAFQIVFLFFKY